MPSFANKLIARQAIPAKTVVLHSISTITVPTKEVVRTVFLKVDSSLAMVKARDEISTIYP